MAGDQNQEKEQGRIVNLSVNVTSRISTSDTVELKIWLAANFAQKWFEDTLREARTGSGPDSVRREILFAVCFAESYILEWVRDEVLERKFQRLTDYFPGGKQSVC